MKLLLFVVLVVAVASSAAACSSTGPAIGLGDMVESVIGSRCVDADAPNSTPEEMADARLAMPITDPKTGMKSTLQEQTAGVVEGVTSQIGIDGIDTSPDALRAKMIASEFTAVPDGGDAGFAAAACNLQSAWEQLRFSADDMSYVERTPHLLHAAGRGICSTLVGSDSAEEELREFDERSSRAQENAAEFRQADIVELQYNLAELQENGVPPDATMLIELITSIEASIVQLQATSDDEHAAAVKSHADVLWAAVKYQCPQFSVVGFGAVCDTVDIPETNVRGIARVHTGNLDCSTTEQIFRDYLSYNRDNDSMMNSWTCWDSAESSAPLVLVTCAANDEFERVVITPA